MTFRSLALKNVKENWRSYSAFFLSSVFSVAIFYIYIAFIKHPDVVSGHIAAASKVGTGMKFCLYIISMFSFIFILYSSTSFLKTRKKEFGLFSLFGMTKHQLRKLVFFENMLIGFLATAVGILVGIVFSKLFYLALGSLLHLKENISFAIPLTAVLTTIIVFIGIFLVITVYATLRIGTGQIIDLLHAHKKPKGELKYAAWQVVLGVLCLGGGYYLAATMSPHMFGVVALPILILVVAGTYFLYTQLSVVVIKMLQRNKKLYYNKSNMLIVGQLGYKIKDNARVLFTITILSAVVMTAMGAVYIMQVLGKEQTAIGTPYSIAWTEQKGNENPVVTEEYMNKVLEEEHFKVEDSVAIEGLMLRKYSLTFNNGETVLGTRNEENPLSAVIIPLSTFKEYAGNEYTDMTLAEQELAVSGVNIRYMMDKEGLLSGELNGEKVQFNVKQIYGTTIMNYSLRGYGIAIIAPDVLYEQWLAQSAQSDQYIFHGIELANWENAMEVTDRLQAEVINDNFELDASRIVYYTSYAQEISLTIFIGLFISLLFFIAAGSLLYFKLFTERDEDINMFKSLSRIGVTYKEMRKIVLTQIGIIFLLPCLVGIIHALFAMFVLDSLLESSNWIYSFVVFGIYLCMQLIYYMFASRSYLSSIRKGAITVTP